LRHIFLNSFIIFLVITGFSFLVPLVHAEKTSNHGSGSSSHAKNINMLLWADTQRKFIAELAVTKEI
jgi:hypothetical protein